MKKKLRSLIKKYEQKAKENKSISNDAYHGQDRKMIAAGAYRENLEIIKELKELKRFAKSSWKIKKRRV